MQNQLEQCAEFCTQLDSLKEIEQYLFDLPPSLKNGNIKEAHELIKLAIARLATSKLDNIDYFSDK